VLKLDFSLKEINFFNIFMKKRWRLPMILVHVPFLWVGGLTFFPWVFFKKQNPPAWLINHERIHLRQQAETGLILFYAWYFLEYLLRLIVYRQRYRAYRNICFEREAYSNDQNLSYLKTRKAWTFWKYL
jgi:hypothetical protein